METQFRSYDEAQSAHATTGVCINARSISVPKYMRTLAHCAERWSETVPCGGSFGGGIEGSVCGERDRPVFGVGVEAGVAFKM